MLACYDRRMDKLQNDIKESRHREDFLYKECKQLDYLIDILAKKDLK